VVVRLDRGKEGKTLAQYEWITDFGNNIATPAVHENFVLVTSEYNHNAICKLEVVTAASARSGRSAHASKACSPVIHNGRLLGVAAAVLSRLRHGRAEWDGGSFGDPGSCIVTADGRLIVWGERGKLVLAESADRSPTAYRELAAGGALAGSPPGRVVLAEGRLYCRARGSSSASRSSPPNRE
jgi:hypothetical protein